MIFFFLNKNYKSQKMNQNNAGFFGANANNNNNENNDNNNNNLINDNDLNKYFGEYLNNENSENNNNNNKIGYGRVYHSIRSNDIIDNSNNIRDLLNKQNFDNKEKKYFYKIGLYNYNYVYEDQIYLSKKQNNIYKEINNLMKSFVEAFNSCAEKKDYFNENDISYMLKKVRNILKYMTEKNLYYSEDIFNLYHFMKHYIHLISEYDLQGKLNYSPYNYNNNENLNKNEKESFLKIIEEVYLYIKDYIKRLKDEIFSHNNEYVKKGNNSLERSRDNEDDNEEEYEEEEEMDNNLNNYNLGLNKKKKKLKKENKENKEKNKNDNNNNNNEEEINTNTNNNNNNNENNNNENEEHHFNVNDEYFNDDDSDSEYNAEDIDIENQREDYEGNGKKFRFNARAVFLTYSKCDVSIHDCMDFLKDKLKIKQIIVSKELHQDGTPHLHVYAEFDKIDTKNVRFFDMNGFHPYITRPKSKYFVIRYVCKKKDFEDFGINAQKYLDEQKEKYVKNKKGKGKMKKILKDVLENKIELVNAVLQEPMLIINYDRIKKNLIEWKIDSLKWERGKIEYFAFNKNIKRRHYWIWGEPDAGKSYFKDKLVKFYKYNIYQMPPNDDWSFYTKEEIFYIDEFEGQIQLHTLNKVCDGHNCKMNTKGGSTYLAVNTLVFIFSNHIPEEVYNKIFKDDRIKFNSLMARFNIFKMSEKGKVIVPEDATDEAITWLGLLDEKMAAIDPYA